MAGRREAEGKQLPRSGPADEVDPLGAVALHGPGDALGPLHGGRPEVEVHAVARAARRGQLGAAVEGAHLERDDRAGRPGAGDLVAIELRAAAAILEPPAVALLTRPQVPVRHRGQADRVPPGDQVWR